MNPNYKQDAPVLITRLCNDLSQAMSNVQPTCSITDYVTQRSAILSQFNLTGGANYSVQSISLRLIVIDSLYSTNANYCYYSIDNLAKAIWDIGTEQDVRDYYHSIACGGKDNKNLFSSKYGQRKNLDEGAMLTSLISKYGYFVMLQNTTNYPLGFPIYDSLVIKMLPLVCDHLGINARGYKHNGILPYVDVLNKVRTALFGTSNGLVSGFQQFDAIDAYMWRLGKIAGGNYSLLFNQADYSIFVKNIAMDNKLFTDFFTQAVKQCRSMNTASIVAGTTNGVIMQDMINHWKNYF